MKSSCSRKKSKWNKIYVVNFETIGYKTFDLDELDKLKIKLNTQNEKRKNNFKYEIAEPIPQINLYPQFEEQFEDKILELF